MLDEKLLQKRLEEFQPEPLVDYDENEDERTPIEIHCVEENENVIDLAKTNYLNFLNCDEIKSTSEDVIRKYGVGTCGPRAFYGTTDVHLNIETHLAEFLQVEECIVYSYGFVAISSSIAAYCNRKDYVFVDEEANVPICQGLRASRSKVIRFSHNDPEDFRSKIAELSGEETRRARKFLIIESISWKTGKLCPLPEFLDIAEQHKMRVFLDETHSLGVLGKTGRGLLERLDIDRSRVDMTFGTVEAAFGSIGGYCAGSSVTIEHQRLSGSGYCFSASQPTYLAQAVIKAIELLEDRPVKLVKLAEEFGGFLGEVGFRVLSDSQSPFKVFTAPDGDREKDRRVYDYCRENGVYFIRGENGLLVNLNVELYDKRERLRRVYDVLTSAAGLI